MAFTFIITHETTINTFHDRINQIDSSETEVSITLNDVGDEVREELVNYISNAIEHDKKISLFLSGISFEQGNSLFFNLLEKIPTEKINKLQIFLKNNLNPYLVDLFRHSGFTTLNELGTTPMPTNTNISSSLPTHEINLNRNTTRQAELANTNLNTGPIQLQPVNLTPNLSYNSPVNQRTFFSAPLPALMNTQQGLVQSNLFRTYELSLTPITTINKSSNKSTSPVEIYKQANDELYKNLWNQYLNALKQKDLFSGCDFPIKINHSIYTFHFDPSNGQINLFQKGISCDIDELKNYMIEKGINCIYSDYYEPFLVKITEIEAIKKFLSIVRVNQERIDKELEKQDDGYIHTIIQQELLLALWAIFKRAIKPGLIASIFLAINKNNQIEMKLIWLDGEPLVVTLEGLPAIQNFGSDIPISDLLIKLLKEECYQQHEIHDLIDEAAANTERYKKSGTVEGLILNDMEYDIYSNLKCAISLGLPKEPANLQGLLFNKSSVEKAVAETGQNPLTNKTATVKEIHFDTTANSMKQLLIKMFCQRNNLLLEGYRVRYENPVPQLSVEDKNEVETIEDEQSVNKKQRLQ